MPQKNCTALTLEQRIEVINKSEKGKLSANNFGVGHSQINSVLKRKADATMDIEEHVSSMRVECYGKQSKIGDF